MSYKKITQCQISGSTNLQLVLSLGSIPLVNEMIKNYNNLPSEEILSKIPGMAFKSKEKFLKKIIKEKEFKNIAEQVA